MIENEPPNAQPESSDCSIRPTGDLRFAPLNLESEVGVEDCANEDHDCVLFDRKHCLLWSQPNPHADGASQVVLDWPAALATCMDMVFAGRSNWRLPTFAELDAMAAIDRLSFELRLKTSRNEATEAESQLYEAFTVYGDVGRAAGYWSTSTRNTWQRIRGAYGNGDRARTSEKAVICVAAP